MTNVGDSFQFPPHLTSRLWGRWINTGHQSIHQAPHCPKSDTMHQSTTRRGEAPGIREHSLNRYPIHQQDAASSSPIDFTGGQVSVREEAAGGCREAILQHL